MTELAIRVSDADKVTLLVELLSSLDFVEQVMLYDRGGDDDQSYPELYVSPQRPQMLKEEFAFEKMHRELLSQYPTEFAAIYRQQLVDHDADELVLAERIDLRYPGELVLIRQILAEPEPPIVFRSPRLIG
jgi:hypothetical protein